MSEREKARERCVARVPDYEHDDGQPCNEMRSHTCHEWGHAQYDHVYLPPRPTLREWLRDAAIWLTPPGWVITLGLIASIVALALLFFDAVPR